MLIKMLDDCRFDFFVMLVVVCLVVFCYEELSCIVIDVGVDWLKYMIWFVDFLIDLKFVVVEIYVFLCLFIKLVVVIDVLGNKSNNIKCILFFFEISCNLN